LGLKCNNVLKTAITKLVIQRSVDETFRTPGDRFTKVIVSLRSLLRFPYVRVYVRFTKLVLSLRVTTYDLRQITSPIMEVNRYYTLRHTTFNSEFPSTVSSFTSQFSSIQVSRLLRLSRKVEANFLLRLTSDTLLPWDLIHKASVKYRFR
jgi:hypothetical protein